MSTPALEALVDIRRTPLELLLKVLDVDGAVRRVQGGWVATGEPWVYDAERYERIAAARVAEQQHMIDYETTTGCRMEFLQRTLDDETATPCGRCDNCAGAWYPTDVAGEAAAAAVGGRSTGSACRSSRGRSGRPASTDSACACKGRIPADERPAEGRALARLTDLGWGGALRELFAPAPPMPRCRPRCSPRACGCSPSGTGPTARSPSSRCRRGRRPQLVDSLARGLAEVRTAAVPRRARAGRRRHRAASPAATAPTASPGCGAGSRPTLELPDGPVLLVDDLADSRWTLTVAARALRAAGATEVLPFVLALRG